MSWLWLLVIPVILASAAGAFFAFQSPKFVVGIYKEVIRDLILAAIPFFRNKPKTPEQWKEIRGILSIRPSERTYAQIRRLKELRNL